MNTCSDRISILCSRWIIHLCTNDCGIDYVFYPNRVFNAEYRPC
jgi:hypothetical protein